MRTITLLLTMALLTGVSLAQDNSESVDSILKELGGYEATAPAAPVTPAPATPSSRSSATEEAPAVDAGADRVAQEALPVVAEVQDLGESASAPVVEEAVEVEEVSESVAEVEPAPVAEVQDLGESAPAAVEEVSEPVAEVAPAEVDEVLVEELIAESRDYYVGGEFAKAQAGFEEAVRLDPENIWARIYLRKILERDHRHAEIDGMEAVSAGWDTSLVLRSYSISADAVEKMGLVDAEGAVDVEVKFPEADFPKGSSAIFQPAMEKIFVRNTRDNLTIIEEILEAMDVSKLSCDVEQVEIEAKFVEVSEGTLEELGFEWRAGELGQTIHTGIEGKDVVITPNQYLFDDALSGGPSGPDMPFLRPADLGAGTLSAGSNAGQTDWTAFRFENTFNKDPGVMELNYGGHNSIDIMISALDQSTGADVLSAPRVVTKSGEEATIRVGQLHTFPEVYEPAASGGNIVHVKYDDWEERLMGIELSVTPQVDGDQIELALNPKVQELQGWQTYDVAPADSAYTWYQYRVGIKFNHAAIQARLPIFRVREIETEVTIADGATVGMGGLVSEKVEAYEDKVPFMGSLPLVGRLFRNEGERAIKRNLLMFVTAKIVEPTGRINTSRSFE